MVIGIKDKNDGPPKKNSEASAIELNYNQNEEGWRGGPRSLKVEDNEHACLLSKVGVCPSLISTLSSLSQ